MKTRIDAGTDVAIIGAWDASRNELIPGKVSFKDWTETLQEDIRTGDLFLIHTGADGGGPIDIYVEEPAPASTLTHARPADGEFLIRVPTGRLVVGGAEDYRSEKPRITGEKSIIQLPAGDYRLRCHIGTEDEWVPEGKLHARLEETVGTEDYRYWRKSKNAGYLGCLTVLLFPMLAYPIGWRLAVLVTLFAMVAWFYGRARFIVKRDARYQRIDKAVNEIVKRAQGNAPPTFVFELNKVTAGSGLKGGEIKL